MSQPIRSQIALAEAALTERDKQDARRIVDAALIVAAMPGLTSSTARQHAIAQLEHIARNHPQPGDMLAAVIKHLESYP